MQSSSSLGNIFLVSTVLSATSYHEFCRELVTWISAKKAKQSSMGGGDEPTLPLAQPPNRCDWASENCMFPHLPLAKCNVMGCHKLLHHVCQVSWQDAKGLSPGGCVKFCHWHHPNWREYQLTHPPAMSAAAATTPATSAKAASVPPAVPFPSPIPFPNLNNSSPNGEPSQPSQSPLNQ